MRTLCSSLLQSLGTRTPRRSLTFSFLTLFQGFPPTLNRLYLLTPQQDPVLVGNHPTFDTLGHKNLYLCPLSRRQPFGGSRVVAEVWSGTLATVSSTHRPPQKPRCRDSHGGENYPVNGYKGTCTLRGVFVSIRRSRQERVWERDSERKGTSLRSRCPSLGDGVSNRSFSSSDLNQSSRQ